MPKTMQADATITGHNITDGARAKHEKDYISSVTCTVEAGSFRIAWKRTHPPPLGSIITVEYKDLNAKGIPSRARIVRLEPSACLDIADLMAKCQIGLKRDRSALNSPLIGPDGGQAPKDGLIIDPTKANELDKKDTRDRLEAGDKIYIPASSKDKGYHILRMPKSGGKIYCSCPAWKFQKLPAAERTCKHCDVVGTTIGESR